MRTTLLFCLATAPLLAAAETELRPFKDGTVWRFQTAVFNGALAQDALRGLHDIHYFNPRTGAGHEGGVATWAVTAATGGPKGGESLVLTESYGYPEEARTTAEVTTALPPRASTYLVGTATSDNVEIHYVVGDRGGAEHETVFLLPVKPKAGMRWYWKTGQVGFKVGKPSAKDVKNGYNAEGRIVSMDAQVVASSSDLKHTCVQVEVTLDEVKVNFWFDPEGGLIRYGGDNLGLSREKLAVERERNDPQQGPVMTTMGMDMIVYFRLPD